MAANDPSVARRDLLLRLRWILWGAVFLLAVVAAILFATHRHSAAKPSALPLIDAPAVTWAAGARRAPGFTLTDQHGRPVSLAALHGRPVLVTFIDPLCRELLPDRGAAPERRRQHLPAGSKPAIVAVSVNIYGNTRAILGRTRRSGSSCPSGGGRSGIRPHSAGLERVSRGGARDDQEARGRHGAHDRAHRGGVPDRREGYERALFLWPYSARASSQTLRALLRSASRSSTAARAPRSRRAR